MKSEIDKLLQHCPPEHAQALKTLSQQKAEDLKRPIYDKFREQFDKLSNCKLETSTFHIDEGKVIIGKSDDNKELEEITLNFNPWRKGPFNWHGVDLDAEWNSSIKWKRMEDALGPLWGKKILDIGCNNGYYMLRAAAEDPAFVLGIDPTARFYYQWKMLTHRLELNNVCFELFGIQDLHLLPQSFDVALCLGILYHHSDPIGQLKSLHGTLNKGGLAIVEVQGIDHPDSMALFPEKRYAKAPGVWFVPSLSCLKNWMTRAGFRDLKVIDSSKTTPEEQRNTPWCPRPFETLTDFLDPEDKNKTVEGYPAPYRHMIMGRR